jgi:hypothetical protein
LLEVAMRRVLTLAALTAGLLLVATPAQAFAHNSVHNPYLHALLDVLTLAVVLSPVATAYAWGPRRRGWLIALIAVVQLPVAIIGFVPIIEPALHLSAVAVAAALTGTSLWLVRRTRTAEATEAEPQTAAP